MAKAKKCDTLALAKSEQKAVVKKSKQIKQKLKTGEIKLRTKFRPKKIKAVDRGLVYISHIPHGFYEEEMRQYFKQFGRVTNVLVCRSSKTGNSKGYGYVEFAHPEVAKIAAETMNNYLMFKKRIIAEFVPPEKRPPHIFHGKRTTINRVPTKIRREKQIQHKNRSIEEETHLKIVKKKLDRVSKKLERLQKLGIECKLSALKTAKKNTGFDDNKKLLTPKVKSPIKEEKSIKKESKITKVLKNKLKLPKKEQEESKELITPKKSKISNKKQVKETKSVKTENGKKKVDKTAKVKAGVKKGKENAVEAINKIKKAGGIVKSKAKKAASVLDTKKLKKADRKSVV